MNAMQPTTNQNVRSDRLSGAEDLFIEMIREIQEDASEKPAFFNSIVEDTGVGFSVGAFNDGRVVGDITGERAASDDQGLSRSARERIARRGWVPPDQAEGSQPITKRIWEGVTSQSDRRHLAEEMLSVATGIYGIDERRKICFRIGGTTR